VWNRVDLFLTLAFLVILIVVALLVIITFFVIIIVVITFLVIVSLLVILVIVVLIVIAFLVIFVVVVLVLFVLVSRAYDHVFSTNDLRLLLGRLGGVLFNLGSVDLFGRLDLLTVCVVAVAVTVSIFTLENLGLDGRDLVFVERVLK
jgi:hypothetical protein